VQQDLSEVWRVTYGDIPCELARDDEGLIDICEELEVSHA